MIRANFLLLPVLLAVFGIATFFVSPGLFTLDEYIYYAGARAFADGGVVVPNSMDGTNSYQLRLWLLVDGPNGLVPQYPIGSAVLGGLLLPLIGLPALQLYNALAAAGVVYLTYHLGRRHFGGNCAGIGAAFLLVLSTFFLEYAFAVWPHAAGMLAILVAVSLLLDDLHVQEPKAWRMVGVGAAIGVGLLFRADVAIGALAIGVALYFFSQKPVKSLVWMGIGLAPFLAILGVVNLYKFGTPNPLSYGQTNDGGTNLASHLPLLAVFAVAGIAALLLRNKILDPKNRKYLIWGAVGAGLLALVFAHGFLFRYVHGFWALIVDATTIQDTRPGVEKLANGTMLFWGHWKKALGQSMPWLGLLGAAFIAIPGVGRKTRWIILILALVWSLPFFPRDWHGGMGSNMRYFLPLVPFACLLAASLIVQLWERTLRPHLVLPLAVFMGANLALTWTAWHPTGLAGTQQILPVLLFLATLFIALLAALKHFEQRRVNLCLMILTGVGIGVGLQLAYIDFKVAQKGREHAVKLSEAHEELPDRTLAFVPSRYLIGWSLEPGHINALPNDRKRTLDDTLVAHAFSQGYRVFLWPRYVTEEIEADERYRLETSDIGLEGAKLVELLPAQ